jgi:hypothetical protein
MFIKLYDLRPISIHKWNKSSGSFASRFPFRAQIAGSGTVFMIKIIDTDLLKSRKTFNIVINNFFSWCKYPPRMRGIRSIKESDKQATLLHSCGGTNAEFIRHVFL